jgi:hypothetical protein
MRPANQGEAKALILIAIVAFLPLARGDPAVATAKIAEWAASDRGGKADYLETSHGQTISTDSLACPGKVTIVDLSSDYCAPCVELAMYRPPASPVIPSRKPLGS